LAVLLVPAVVLGGFSMWFFEASWIGVAMLLVGVVVAVLGSIRPVKRRVSSKSRSSRWAC
jgi:hypothetical protein